MTALPVSYMKAIRHLTGFWAAYPLSQELAPGAYGRRVEGRFVADGHLSDLPGWDPDALATAQAPARAPADAWLSDGVSVERLAVSADGPALPAAGRIRLRFSQAEQAAFACRNGREWAFAGLRRVKEHLIRLYRDGHWDHRDILITHVLRTDAAWLFYSSRSGQSVDLGVSVAPGPAAAADLLKAAIGGGDAEIGYSGVASSGYSSTLNGPATPLFQAIRIRRVPAVSAEIVVKGAGPFEEPSFGDPEDG